MPGSLSMSGAFDASKCIRHMGNTATYSSKTFDNRRLRVL